MSLETPDNPSKPLFLFNNSSLCEADSFSSRARNASTPGSRSPHRVPMINPSKGETHRRIHGSAVIDGAYRCSVAQMAANKAQLVRPSLQEFGGPQCDV